jgi:hypothetical protein
MSSFYDQRQSSFLRKGTVITNSTIAPQGQLYQLTTEPYFIYKTAATSIFDASILKARFAGKSIRALTPVQMEQFSEGTPVKLPDGTLIKTTTNPTVYVISEGMRREIPSESIFNAFGYSWTNIIDVPDNVLNLHPLGDALESATADSVQSAKE